MIGGPQPSGGMEGLKSQLKGNPEAAAGDPNGTTDQAAEGDEADKGNFIEKFMFTRLLIF